MAGHALELPRSQGFEGCLPEGGVLVFGGSVIPQRFYRNDPGWAIDTGSTDFQPLLDAFAALKLGSPTASTQLQAAIQGLAYSLTANVTLAGNTYTISIPSGVSIASTFRIKARSSSGSVPRCPS